MTLSPLNQRRLSNFKRNRRAWYSLWIFLTLFVISLFAEFIANDKPILVRYRGEFYMPVLQFYSESEFGGTFKTEAIYRDPEVKCLIASGGLEACFDDPEGVIADAEDGVVAGEAIETGWALWPIIPHSFNRPVDIGGQAPSPPSADNWLGTDDVKRDVAARIVYGFRISMLFAIIVTVLNSILGAIAGAVQGYFGGRTDLIFQRLLEIWGSMPGLMVIIILFTILGRSFTILVVVTVLFGWTALVGLVRAEFLRARNFEYVRAAQALGVSDSKIMFRHVLPNAMVSSLTMLPFMVTGAISTLATLDFLGLGLPTSYPSLGELTQQAKANLYAPWLAFSAIGTFTLMLTLLIFIFEGVRDAFDPRKTFR